SHLLWLTGDTRRAASLMLKAIASGGAHPENAAWCRAELGIQLFNQGALVPAEQQLEAAMNAAPKNPHVLAAMARLKTARKDYSAAIDLHEQAVAIAPQHRTLAALADLYLLAGDSEKAGKMIQRVLDFHAAHDRAHATNRWNGQQTDSTGPRPRGNAELARFLADHDRDLDRALEEAEAAYQTYNKG